MKTVCDYFKRGGKNRPWNVTQFFVDINLTKVQFFSMFSAIIYSAHKVVKNLQKSNIFGIGDTYFKKLNL